MAISIVQTTQTGSTSTGASAYTTANFGASCTAGNTIVVFFRSAENTDFTGITDTLGTTYGSPIESHTGSDPMLWVYVGLLGSSGTNAVSANYSAGSGNQFSWVFALELSNVRAVSPVDDSSVINAALIGSTLLGAAITTTDSTDIVLVGATQNTLASYTAGTNYTLSDGTIGNADAAPGSPFGGVEYRLPGTTLSGHQAPIDTDAGAGSSDYTMIVIALRETAPANKPRGLLRLGIG